MHLTRACGLILDQLQEVVSQITAADFSKPSPALSHSSVGQHLRHTIEFFLCLENGFRDGVVNYDKRAHDKLIENDKFIALNAIRKVREFVVATTNDSTLLLEVSYDGQAGNFVAVQTNYFRELVYNIEHAVHHMALIKIAIREVAGYVQLPDEFGVAVSTIRHKERAVNEAK